MKNINNFRNVKGYINKDNKKLTRIASRNWK